MNLAPEDAAVLRGELTLFHSELSGDRATFMDCLAPYVRASPDQMNKVSVNLRLSRWIDYWIAVYLLYLP